MARRWLPSLNQVIRPYIKGPKMLASRIAKVHRPKNSPNRCGGTIKPAMARPEDWLEPMQKPAIPAAHQKVALSVDKAAMKQVATQPSKVRDKVSLCPKRSCTWPNTKAPTKAAMFSTKINTMVSCGWKPMTCSA